MVALFISAAILACFWDYAAGGGLRGGIFSIILVIAVLVCALGILLYGVIKVWKIK
mgnify:CR=1 FL=1